MLRNIVSILEKVDFVLLLYTQRGAQQSVGTMDSDQLNYFVHSYTR